MTTITTYNELKQNITDFGKRPDALSKYDLFVDLAERDIFESLRIQEMDARATASTSTSDRFLALPSGFISMRRLQITIDSVLYDMDQKNIKDMRIIDSANVPTEFSVTSQIEFNRTSDQVYTVEMQYFKELTGLSSSNTTNDILTKYPMVYLSGCMKHFYRWAKNYEELNYWEGLFHDSIARANKKASGQRYFAPSMSFHGGMIV